MFINDEILDKMKHKGVIGDIIDTNINSIAPIPWLTKTLFEVRDHKFNYFVVRDSTFTKKREIMMPDQQQRLSG